MDKCASHVTLFFLQALCARYNKNHTLIVVNIKLASLDVKIDVDVNDENYNMYFVVDKNTGYTQTCGVYTM